MSGPAQPPIPPKIVPNPMTVKGVCLNCGAEMMFVMPTPRIFNEIDVSVLAIAHPPSRCQKCQTIHLPLIEGITAEGVFQLMWKPAKSRRSPLVVAGGDEALSDAIRTANLAEKFKN